MALNNIFVKKSKKSYDGTTLVPQKIDYNKMPNCIYTFPEVASVGLIEEECKNAKIDYLVKKLRFKNNGKALADGFVKIIIGKKYNEIIGVHILCSTATDMISEIVNIMGNEGTIVELANSCHHRSTLSEVVMDAAQDLKLEWYKVNKKIKL